MFTAPFILIFKLTPNIYGQIVSKAATNFSNIERQNLKS